MSFFNSLRRRTAAADRNENDRPRTTSAWTRHRARNALSLTPRKRQPIPWELKMSKSDDDLDDKITVTEQDVYPKFDPQNPDHALDICASKQAGRDGNIGAKARGRSFSWSKSLPFSSFRSRSRSRSRSKSRSSSPSRGFLHKAAEFVRAPTALFYKDPGSEDSGNPLIDSVRTPKSVRPRKSVHFLFSDDEEETGKRSSPIDIPGRSAPSLPPVEVSTSGSMNLDIENVAALTARPPATPLIKACITQALDVPLVDTYSGLLAAAIAHQQPVLPEFRRPQPNIADPFSDKAEISNSGLAAGLSNHGGDIRPKHIGLPSEAELKAVCEAPKDHTCPITPGSMTHPVSGNNTVGVSNNPEADEILGSKQSVARYPSFTGQVHLPLRPKHSISSFMLDQDVVLNSQDGQATCSSKDNAHSQSMDSTSGTFCGPSNLSSEQTRERAVMSVGDCVERLRILSAEDTTEKQAMQILDDLHTVHISGETGTTDRSAASRNNASISPVRRKFRFENRSDTSSAQQSIVSAENQLNEQSTSVRTSQYPLDVYTVDAVQTPRYQAGNQMSFHTPSPSAIPLPSSILQNERVTMPHQAHTFRDQHGWSPFAEEQFPDAALDVILSKDGENDFAHILCKNGGFSELWKFSGLPQATAPSKDSKPPTLREAELLMDAIIGWVQYQHNTQPNNPNPASKQETQFPIKYFKRRDNSPNKAGFFAPVTKIDYNRSTEALSDATHSISLGSGDDTVTQTNRSSSSFLEEKDCQQPGCSCSPCECGQCECGSSGGSEGCSRPGCTCSPCECSQCSCGSAGGDERCLRPGCTCSPCNCAQCDCGSTEEEAQDFTDHQYRNHLVHYQRLHDDRMTLSPIDEAFEGPTRMNSKIEGTEGEMVRQNIRSLHSDGGVPIPYCYGASSGSKGSLTSDTSIDEEEAYCVGLV